MRQNIDTFLKLAQVVLLLLILDRVSQTAYSANWAKGYLEQIHNNLEKIRYK